MINYWWCEHCGVEVDSRNVTNDEKHDTCGNEVVIESIVTESDFKTLVDISHYGYKVIGISFDNATDTLWTLFNNNLLYEFRNVRYNGGQTLKQSMILKNPTHYLMLIVSLVMDKKYSELYEVEHVYTAEIYKQAFPNTEWNEANRLRIIITDADVRKTYLTIPCEDCEDGLFEEPDGIKYRCNSCKGHGYLNANL